MNRADRMLEVLRDGRVHSRAEIFDRVGFMLTNNAAAELRARGYTVEQRQEGRTVFTYRLVSSPQPLVATESAPPLLAGGCGEPAQLSLDEAVA